MIGSWFPIIMFCTVTAYTPSFEECGKTDGITASGVKATVNRTIACDHLPFGTKVKILGKEYIVEDRFGGDYTDKIDIYMEDKDAAYEFGKQYLLVLVERQNNEEYYWKKSNLSN